MAVVTQPYQSRGPYPVTVKGEFVGTWENAVKMVRRVQLKCLNRIGPEGGYTPWISKFRPLSFLTMEELDN